MNETFCEAKLEYPRPWTYKVIGADKDGVRAAIDTVFGHKECRISYSNRSRSGKYHSWCVETEVGDEGERDFLFTSIRAHVQVKMVL